LSSQQKPGYYHVQHSARGAISLHPTLRIGRLTVDYLTELLVDHREDLEPGADPFELET
jgi:hypothetical protein